MSVQHRKDSIRGMRLERLGIQPPSDWNNVEETGDRRGVFRGNLRRG